MALDRRRSCPGPLLPWILLLLLILVLQVQQCEAARSTSILKVKPKPSKAGHFLESMPRGIPIPSSGPSRKHNQLGLETWSRSSP